MKTIYNTYVVMESQEQCDRMKKLCIDNDLPIWDDDCAFEFYGNYNLFSYEFDCKEFFILPYLIGTENKTKVTEQEFINLLNKHNDEFLEWFVKNPSFECVEIKRIRFINKSSKEFESYRYKIIIPKEKPKQKLDINTCRYFNIEVGCEREEFICENQELKQEKLEEAAEKYSENWEEITGLDYENVIPSEVNKLDFINGAKWQQEQNKNLYSEEQVELIAHEMVNCAIDNIGSKNPQSGKKFDEVLNKFKKK